MWFIRVTHDKDFGNGLERHSFQSVLSDKAIENADRDLFAHTLTVCIDEVKRAIKKTEDMRKLKSTQPHQPQSLDSKPPAADSDPGAR
jgi:hypothetical protein